MLRHDEEMKLNIAEEKLCWLSLHESILKIFQIPGFKTINARHLTRPAIAAEVVGSINFNLAFFQKQREFQKFRVIRAEL